MGERETRPTGTPGEKPDFGVSTPDGGHWEGRFFVWDMRTKSMARDISASERQRLLRGRSLEDGDDA
jgi:hypothetical protein